MYIGRTAERFPFISFTLSSGSENRNNSFVVGLNDVARASPRRTPTVDDWGLFFFMNMSRQLPCSMCYVLRGSHGRGTGIGSQHRLF